MADVPPKRKSRFDAPDSAAPPRKSRFDRENRSRSPAPDRSSDGRRDRSPLPRRLDDGKATASERAAKISADVAARSGAARSEYVPSYRSSGDPVSVTSDIYVQDGDFMKDIEINDLRNRYTLTKGDTQKTIKERTGADVTTRGEYYPDKKMAKASSPPLHLHITCTSREGLEKAIDMIEDLMKQDLPNLVDERRLRRTREPDDVQRDERGRRKWPEERIPIDLEPISGFNLRAQVVGQGGANVKWIQQSSSAKIQIKGAGSGFIESDTGEESREPMYLHVTAPTPDKVDFAKTLCQELLDTVKADYQQFKERNQNRGYGGYGGHGGNNNNHGKRGRGSRGDSEDQYGNGNDPYSAYGNQSYGAQPAPPAGAAANQYAQSAPPLPDTADPAQIEAYYIQLYGYNPYEPYGGYAAYAQAYMLHQQQASQQPAASYADGTTAYAGATAGYPGASYPDSAASYAGATAYPAAPGTYHPTASYYLGAPTSDPNAAPPPPLADNAPPPPPDGDAPPPPPPGA